MATSLEVTWMIRRAAFSRCGRYRYALWREWNPSGPTVLVVALNPSTADHRRDDPTIRRCIQFAKDWGFGRLTVANLFAYRTPEPRLLCRVDDPVGPANDDWLSRLAREAEFVVAAWGARGDHRGRAAAVAPCLGRLHCLGLTQGGAPRHPLYVRGDVRPVPLAI
jgi:hypothetical protein